VDARTHLWLVNQSLSPLSPLDGGSLLGSPAPRSRSTVRAQRKGFGSTSRAVTARHKRKKGFLRRFHLGKLIGQAARFTVGRTPLGPLI